MLKSLSTQIKSSQDDQLTCTGRDAKSAPDNYSAMVCVRNEINRNKKNCPGWRTNLRQQQQQQKQRQHKTKKKRPQQRQSVGWMSSAFRVCVSHSLLLQHQRNRLQTLVLRLVNALNAVHLLFVISILGKITNSSSSVMNSCTPSIRTSVLDR